ncbi:MAG: hypothetical protein E7089_04260 [Bacteroidales bacterium]|nr:hypothetical protein [Bacteroidales bacterium]
MIKKIFIVCLLFVAGIYPATAQTNNESFDEFRKSIRKDFFSFRKSVLDDYSKFLAGVWKDYNSFAGKERNKKPKPKSVPVVKDNKEPQKPIVAPPVKDKEPQKPVPPHVKDKEPHKPVTPNVGQPHSRTFAFYASNVTVPQSDWSESLPVGDSKEHFPLLWEAYKKHGVEKKILPVLSQFSTEHKLNDWFLCELIRAYCDSEFSDCGRRITLAHYLLLHSGYDVKLGLTSKKEPFLLIYIKQQVYSRAYVNQDGKKYYLFFDNESTTDAKGSISFSTYDVPKNADCGKYLNLQLVSVPVVPGNPHNYKFEYGGLCIKGEVNANVMQMLYRYPQMDIADYAMSAVTASQQSVASQLKSQLDTLPVRVAVDKLLHFVQRAFEYATDDEQHGFEKPYFFDEMLFYPKCDCEDRSIFYSYLLKQVLGLENHLVNFPGHECVYVNLGVDINGCGYLYDNKKFYVSDPTYIGAVTGMCMEQYKNENPKIDFKR